MMNDPILNCLLVEVGKSISEVEYKAPRHEIVRILDEASRSIAELGISKRKPEPVKPLKETKPTIARAFLQYQEILIFLHETNPDNVSLSVREWYEMNTEYFDSYFKCISSPYCSLSSVIGLLIKKGYMERSYDSPRNVSASVCKLTPKGLRYAKGLHSTAYVYASEAYKKHFGGKQNALGF